MSSAAAEKALRTAIRKREFAPAYYLYGEDDYLKEELLRELVDAAVDPATRDFNLDIRRGQDLNAETLGSLLSTPPMMAERRVLVVRDVGALRKEARAVLDQQLNAPAPDGLLVLTAPAGSKIDKVLLAKTESVEFVPLSGARIPRWIVYYVEHDLRSTITPAAVTLLQEAVGTELAQLKIELDKLATFVGHAVFDEAAVSAVVGVRTGETLGDFLDAVARRDGRAAVTMLSGILQQPKTGAVPVVMMLTTQALAMAWARAERDRGVPAGRLSGELFALLKEGSSSMTGRAWGEAVRAWTREIDRWTAASLDDALEALLEADTMLKGSRVSSDEQLLSTLVLRLCTERARRAA